MDKLFKIIAIQPLEGCASYIIKNLKKEIYYFYQGYKIVDDDTIEIRNDILLPPAFFVNDGINISVHAIVGKNGSGKSAIIELLMRVINNLSYIHNGAELGENQGVVTILEVAANLYFQIGDKYYKIHLSKLENKTIVPATIKELSKGSKAENIESSNLLKQIQPFFYTILNNYSFYAYNTNDYERERIRWGSPSGDDDFDIPDRDWIDGVCHKNDGYSTPIVVNPMRIKGNIDVNTETHLTRSRLLSLLVDLNGKNNSLKEFETGSNIKRKIEYIYLSYPEDIDRISVQKPFVPEKYKKWKYKLREYIPNQVRDKLFNVEFDNTLFEDVCCLILEEWKNANELEEKIKEPITFDLVNNDVRYNYVVAKTMSIINKYQYIICPETKAVYSFEKKFGLSNLNKDEITKIIQEHIVAIRNDRSHITLKIKQALNYIKFTEDTYKFHDTINDRRLTPTEFNSIINKMSELWAKDDFDILHFMPPSFIKVTIDYIDAKSTEEYPFNYLSSGEKQLIYYTTTILYHLRNLESAFYSKYDRVKYNYVNIVLEEIELYFHPEMQRIMVQSLLKNIHDMDFKHILGIDLCLITHSPIILSDIPRQNILFLENGKSIDVAELTFGANIHSLYSHSFFMNLPMGEFAKSKIENIQSAINHHDFSQNLYKQIQLIGEPIIRNILTKLYNEKKEKHIDKEEKIKLLEEELIRLRQNND